MKKKCETCAFCEAEQNAFFCRALPPTPNVIFTPSIVGQPPKPGGQIAMQPVVQPGQWCGLWRQKQNPEDN